MRRRQLPLLRRLQLLRGLLEMLLLRWRLLLEMLLRRLRLLLEVLVRRLRLLLEVLLRWWLLVVVLGGHGRRRGGAEVHQLQRNGLGLAVLLWTPRHVPELVHRQDDVLLLPEPVGVYLPGHQLHEAVQVDAAWLLHAGLHLGSGHRKHEVLRVREDQHHLLAPVAAEGHAPHVDHLQRGLEVPAGVPAAPPAHLEQRAGVQAHPRCCPRDGHGAARWGGRARWHGSKRIKRRCGCHYAGVRPLSSTWRP
mmetsp:Transcript_62747/g.178326  ORF Transcript_62747/g.178326 Transcript_62747/m.178326 type:complete len:250 (-) Transcript_62747:2-751(-)